MKFLLYWILIDMGMREGCLIKCIGNYLVEDLFFCDKNFEVLFVFDVLFKRYNVFFVVWKWIIYSFITFVNGDRR